MNSQIGSWHPAQRVWDSSKSRGELFCAGMVALLVLLVSGPTAFAQTTLSPATLSFGNQPVGVASIAKSTTLRNTQAVPLTIFSIAISGAAAADYSWGGTCPISPSTLAAGKSCSIPVTFTPSVLGSRIATLTVTHSATTSPQSVALTGNGIAAVSVSPASVAFSSLFVGTTSPEKTVTLVNHLNTALTVSSVAASGNFAIVINTCGSTVAAGQKCTIGVTFTPTALGSRQGTLTISYVASGSPILVPLSGTGTDTGLTSISVTPANPSIGISGTQQFAATGNLRGGTTQNLTSFVAWSSSKANVATITSSGLATGVTLGTSTISATLGGITGPATLTVSGAPVLVSIAVTPANDSISAGTTQVFTATGTYSDGSKQNLTNIATWNSSATSVATILQTGLLTAVGLGQTTIEATSGSINGSTTLTVTPGFVFTGSLSTPRSIQTATELNNGMVLVAGGDDNNGLLVAAAELYNPSTGSFGLTGNLNTPRIFHTATLLNNGTVLVVGGQDNSGAILASAELYDPAKGTFAFTGSLNIGREYHAMTVLSNGKVLISGGIAESGYPATAELYDPTTGTFTLTGSLNTARYVHSATALNNGLVLIAGGRTPPTADSTNSAELYDPSTGTFTPTGNLKAARNQQTATLLNNGLVLILGGINEDNVIASAELYDPTVGIFNSTASLNTARALCPATLLSNGMVLIAGGTSISGDTLASAELYDPTTEQFTFTGSMNEPRDFQSATLLNNGTALVAGGGSTAAAELYEAASLTPPNLVSIVVTPGASSLSPGATQQFIATGTFSDSSTQQLASVTWISSNASIAQISNDATNHGVALAVASGKVTITAAAGTISGSATLTVTHP